MIKIEVRGMEQTIREIENSYHEFLERVADTITEAAPKFTPKRTGRAREGWENNSRKGEILVENKVPYVGYLEKPYVKSRQAPQGIIGPTLTSVKGKIK
jgi:phosphoenolpyruvate carboxylase